MSHNKDLFGTYLSVMCDIGVINAHFNRWDTVRQSLRRWYGPHLGINGLLTSLFIKRHYKFIGFVRRHFEQPYLRSTFEQVWKEEPEPLQESCTRFRSEVSLNPYIFRYWQFATNNFYPKTFYKTKYINLRISVFGEIEDVLNDPKTISVCLNDTANCSDDEFMVINDQLQILFERKFPIKSKYEV